MGPLLQARIARISYILAEHVAEITVPRVDYHSFRIKAILTDASTVRINEQHYRDTRERYAYYWLDEDNDLIVGWDSAPITCTSPVFRITGT